MSRVKDKETAIKTLLTGITGVRTLETYRGQLLDLKDEALKKKLDAIFIWFDGTIGVKAGQFSGTKEDEFHALVTVRAAGRSSRRQETAYTIAEKVEDKVTAKGWDHIETEVLINDGTLAVLAIKFSVGETY